MCVVYFNIYISVVCTSPKWSDLDYTDYILGMSQILDSQMQSPTELLPVHISLCFDRSFFKWGNHVKKNIDPNIAKNIDQYRSQSITINHTVVAFFVIAAKKLGLSKMLFSCVKQEGKMLAYRFWVKPHFNCGIWILQRSHQSNGGQDWVVVSLSSRDSANSPTF